MAAAHHGEAVGVVEIRATGQQRHGLLAGVDQVVVFVACGGRRAHAQNAVLALQDDFAPFRDVVGHQGGLADAQVHVGTVVDVLRHAAGQFVFASF